MNNYSAVDNNTEYLEHYGRVGMKWGQNVFAKRYMNPDGSLNERGKKRVNKLRAQYELLTGKKFKKPKTNEPPSKKFDTNLDKVSNRNLSDDQLYNKIERLRSEQTARNLERDVRTSSGRKLANRFLSEAVTPAVMDAGRNVIQRYLNQKLSSVIGLDKPHDEFAKTKRDRQQSDNELKILENKKRMKALMKELGL